MKENSIEEDIKIALDKFSYNKDIDSAILIVEKFILGNYILVGGNRGNIVRDSLRYILSDYKRVLKENEQLRTEVNSLKKENEELKNDYENLSNSVVVKNHCIKNSIPVSLVKDKIEEIQIEYNKLDKEVDEYINDANKELSKYYENKEKIGEMQTLSWCIDNLQELLKKED